MRDFTCSLMSTANLLQVGPMVGGITPQEASERLNTFQVIIYFSCRDNSHQEFELESDKLKFSNSGLGLWNST